MDHPDITRLRAYLHDQATPAESEHIEQCDHCAQEIEQMMPPVDPTVEQQLRDAAQLPSPILDPVPTPANFDLPPDPRWDRGAGRGLRSGVPGAAAPKTP